MGASHTFRRRWLAGPLTLALFSPCAQGAAFLPGAEADPPTGDVAQVGSTATEPLRGGGIQWSFAPWRFGGTVALDLRALRMEDGRTSRQYLLISDVEMASYIWQPWFVQVRLGAGFVAAQSGGSDAQTSSDLGGTLTGRAAIVVFPASRFPFELRAEASDSRTGGVGLGAEYRSRRVLASQGWRPATGNAQVHLQVGYSELLDGVSRDTLSTLNATAMQQSGPHLMELTYTNSDNRRSDTDEQTRLSSLNARHAFNPAGSLNVNTIASWNEARQQGASADMGSDVRQVASFVSWRGANGLWAGSSAPQVAATARWVQTRSLSSGQGSGDGLQAVNVSLGASQELGPTWRASLSGSASHQQSSTLTVGDSAGAQASLTWAPHSTMRAGWRYGPSASLTGGYFRATSQEARQTLGLQGSHGVSRDHPLSESSSLSLSLTQSAAVLQESGTAELAGAVAHGASVSWQSMGADGGGQTFGGLSYTDSQTLGTNRGHFKLLNLQINQRSQLTRYSHWALNLTVQGANNSSSELDAFTGQRRELGGGWQRSYSGALSYEHQRALGVPRLRHSVLLSVNSQQLEQRALGDIDAPRERISESLESRLDYAIGRLDTRLSVRIARVDGRMVAALQARAQRRF